MRSSSKALENAQPKLTDAFDLLDRDHDGFVTVDDLVAIFAASPNQATAALDAAQIGEMLQRAAPPSSAELVERLTLEDFGRLLLLPQSALSAHLNEAVRSAGGAVAAAGVADAPEAATIAVD